MLYLLPLQREVGPNAETFALAYSSLTQTPTLSFTFISRSKAHSEKPLGKIQFVAIF